MLLPDRVLGQVVWTLKPLRYDDVDHFDASIRDYHGQILGDDDRWRPHERVALSPRLRLLFECHEADEPIEVGLELHCPDIDGWTNLDAMFAIQQAVAAYLIHHDASLGDHKFFEGLTLVDLHAEPPLYRLDLGS